MRPTLTHIAMHVRDQAACIDFYRDYCAMSVVHERTDDGNRIVWMAEAGKEGEFIIVLMPGGPEHIQEQGDYSHLGFAVDSRADVDRIAERGRRDGILVWPPTDLPYPVGYFCGLRDPNGTCVEFSFGQPLGPGADNNSQ